MTLNIEIRYLLYKYFKVTLNNNSFVPIIISCISCFLNSHFCELFFEVNIINQIQIFQTVIGFQYPVILCGKSSKEHQMYILCLPLYKNYLLLSCKVLSTVNQEKQFSLLRKAQLSEKRFISNQPSNKKTDTKFFVVFSLDLSFRVVFYNLIVLWVSFSMQ